MGGVIARACLASISRKKHRSRATEARRTAAKIAKLPQLLRKA
jgi:hypothetical protein